MIVKKGNIIESILNDDYDVLIHGCNCFHTMGRGIAKQIKQIFPEACVVDKKTNYGDKNKLGEYSSCRIQRNNKQITIINGYTQYNYGMKGIYVDYNSIKELFQKIKKDYTGRKICFPKIGAGTGGGDWDKISQIIDEELKGEIYACIDMNP